MTAIKPQNPTYQTAGHKATMQYEQQELQLGRLDLRYGSPLIMPNAHAQFWFHATSLIAAATGLAFYPVAMAEFVDAEARHSTQIVESRCEILCSSYSDIDSSQSIFPSASSKKQRKRRLVFSGEESSDGESCFTTREKKKTRNRRDNATRHAHERKVLKELQKSNNILVSLLERVDKTEKRLRVVEEEISKSSTSISSSDTTPCRSRKCWRTKSRCATRSEGKSYAIPLGYSHSFLFRLYSGKHGECTLC